MSGTCAVHGCDEPTRARGHCAHHYNKLRRYGDPLYDGNRPPLIPGVLAATGATYRQLDHWVRRGWLHPTDPAPGNGYRRDWPHLEMQVAALMRRLTAAGININVAARLARALAGNGAWTVELGPGLLLTVQTGNNEQDGP